MASPLRLDRPVFIIGPPRSGSTLLYQVLANGPEVYAIGGESHAIIEGIPALRPSERDWESNRLTAQDATPEVVRLLTEGFQARMSDRVGKPPVGDAVLLEKTPKNVVRVSFLDAAFPDARFIYLHREPVETISSMIEGWRSPPPKFKTYPELPGWPGPLWSFVLVPGWRDFVGMPIPELVARQWSRMIDLACADLSAIPQERWMAVDFADLIANPASEVDRVRQFIGWPPDDQDLGGGLPLSGSQISAPAPEKWRKHAHELEPVMPLAAETAARAAELNRLGHR